MTEEFYTQEGQVKDPVAAEELAYLEKPARNREAGLKRETEVGLTKEQEDNITIMDSLQEKYPNAFDEIIDDKGRKVLAMTTWGDSLRALHSSAVYFSQEGVFGEFSNNPARYTNDQINFSKVLDAVSEARSKPRANWEAFSNLAMLAEDALNSAGRERKHMLEGSAQDKAYDKYDFMLLDLSNRSIQDSLKQAMLEAEKQMIGSKENAKKVAKSKEAETILSNL